MSQCVVIVQFDLPKRSDQQAIAGGAGTAPTYRDLANRGLISKHYLNGESGTGGVYVWESRAAAEAWYTDALLGQLTERFGVRPTLTWYDNHVVVDNVRGETRVDGVAIAEADAAE